MRGHLEKDSQTMLANELAQEKMDIVGDATVLVASGRHHNEFSPDQFARPKMRRIEQLLGRRDGLDGGHGNRSLELNPDTISVSFGGWSVNSALVPAIPTVAGGSRNNGVAWV